MALVRRSETQRWDPFRELEEMTDRLNRLFAPLRSGDGERETFRMAEWTPSCNISEAEDGYYIDTELPGVKKDDVHVTLESGVLTIEGERKEEKEEKKQKYHRKESFHGTFMRRFSVPEDADENRIEANFDEGILKIRIPKTEEKKSHSKEIAIS